MRVSSPIDRAKFSAWMDQFRWVAALVVVVSHVGGPLLVSLSQLAPEDRPSLQYAYSFIAGFAHPAVMIFFVLSGYFVGGSLCAENERQRPSATDYFSKRIVRLWIVLIPTLVLSYALTLIGTQIYPVAYSDEKYAAIGAQELVCNLAFLQNAFCLRFAGNDSLWSLFNEFWYYVVFFLLVLGFGSRESIFTRALYLCSSALIISLLTYFQFSNAFIAPYFLIWLMGVYVSYADRPRIFTSSLGAGALLLVYLTVVRLAFKASEMHGTSGVSLAVDVGTAVLFSKLLVNMKFSAQLADPILGNWNFRLAAFSYTLYCLHLPLAVFYSASMQSLFGYGHEMVASGLFEWLVVFGCFLFVIPVSYVLYYVTERNTNALRIRILQIARFSRSSPTQKHRQS